MRIIPVNNVSVTNRSISFFKVWVPIDPSSGEYVDWYHEVEVGSVVHYIEIYIAQLNVK